MHLGEGISGGVRYGPDSQLVIDLGIDAAEFKNEIPRIKTF